MLRRLFITSLLLLGGQWVVASELPTADPALRQALQRAVADSSSFDDRFEAEVWLMDMSNRLTRFLSKREERLHLLRLVHAEARRSNLDPEVVLAVIEVDES